MLGKLHVSQRGGVQCAPAPARFTRVAALAARGWKPVTFDAVSIKPQKDAVRGYNGFPIAGIQAEELEPRKAPVELIVADHIDKTPTES
jgi:hypothetical protein